MKETIIPTYCYKTQSGRVVEREFRIGEAPAEVWVDGKMARRDYQAEQVKVPSLAGWPMEPCVSSGVHASQAGELREFLKKSGVPTEVTPGGDPVYRDKNHRTKALKVRGLVDRN